MLASYNGEKFIAKQIESILNQKDVVISLVVRDDGSTDKTLDILKKYSSEGKIKLYSGDGAGVASNFYELLHLCENCDYYAWADQDDIWDDDKIIQAVRKLESTDSKFKLYFGNERRIDKNDKEIPYHSYFDKARNPQVSFAGTMISNQARGATMVFNKALLDILLRYKPEFKKSGSLHDSWLNTLSQAIGAKIIYDLNKHMSYRIHENNVVARKSYFSKFKALMKVSSTINHSIVAEELLKNYSDLITPENKRILDYMCHYQNSKSIKLKIIFSKDFSTGYLFKDLKFRLMVLMNVA